MILGWIIIVLLIIVLVVLGVITLVSWISCITDERSIENIKKVKSENGIIFNPLKHLYYVHQGEFPTIKISLIELILLEPGYFISQFHRNISFNKFLENKYGSKDNED